MAVLAISGLGGVGKTQVAVEHAWRRAGDYDLVWWVPAEVSATIPSSLARLAERLGIPTDSDQARVVTSVREELARREHWLLVFDNAEDPEQLVPYRPTGLTGHVIVTSRNPAWRGVAASLDIGVMSGPDATTFLLRRSGSDDYDAAGRTADELGYLPLALEQAAAYVDETGMALRGYVALIERQPDQLMERGSPAFYEATVASTWRPSFDSVEAVSSVAADLVHLCAFLAPDEIPIDLLAARRDDPLAVEDAIAHLRRFSLVQRRYDGLSIHRLVQAVIRKEMTFDVRRRWIEQAIQLLLEAFPPEPQDNNSRPRCARLLPHVLVVAQHASREHASSAALARLLEQAAVHLWSIAHLVSARDLLEQALSIRETAYDVEQTEVAVTLGTLGIVYHHLGDLARARDRLEQALLTFEEAYGSEHPQVARTRGYVGMVLADLGDTHGAKERLEQALIAFEAVYGSKHPEVGIALINLGVVERKLGNLAVAQQRLERALAIFEARYGSDHPETARTLGNLGIVRRQLGDLAGARDLLERARVIFETVYGPDHPEVGSTLINLGIVVGEMEDVIAARAYHEQALAIMEAAYGSDHPKTNLARRELSEYPACRDIDQKPQNEPDR